MSETNEDLDEDLDEEELLRRMLAGESENEEGSSEPSEDNEIPESEDEAKIQIWKWFFSLNFVFKVMIVLVFLFILVPMIVTIVGNMHSFLDGGHNQLGTFFK